jgi:hypothetical protein
MLGGIAQPIVTATGVETHIGTWTVDTFPESLVFVPLSLLFLLVGPRILLGLGTIAGQITAWFLGHIGVEDLKRAVTQSLAQDGEMGGLAILDQLQLRFGRGARLSPIRVQAALIALESTGNVTARAGATGLVYRLSERT